MPSLSVVRVIATGFVLLVFAGAAAISLMSIERPTFWFPAFVAVAGTLSALYALTQDLRKIRAGESVVDGEVTDLGASVYDESAPGTEENPSSTRRRVLVWTLWFLALPLLALVIPFFYASLLWLVAVLRWSARRGWISILVSVGVFALVLNLLIVLLEIHVPPALLTGWG
ncbi:hypothetical protein [Agromyces sp. NPDC049794]|uniref:hypothetical protein n=1 Tax=unclassified Agromyces TaxID=2639701 RepID=UPI00340C67F3